VDLILVGVFACQLQPLFTVMPKLYEQISAGPLVPQNEQSILGKNMRN
jgi:hypothetical protein